MKEIVTIQISDYLSLGLAKDIALAQWHSDQSTWVNRIGESIYSGKYHSDCFNVISRNRDRQVVGRLQCFKNQKDPSLWCYGDLFVTPPYRRNGIAAQMIQTAIDHLTEIGATRLRCYVDPNNDSSLQLQTAVGFEKKPFETFDNFINDGDIMWELELGSLLSVSEATIDNTRMIMSFYEQNREHLHGEALSYEIWEKALSGYDPDEKYYMVWKGCVPVAWYKINHLNEGKIAWLSMLVVSDRFQRQGIGSYAVQEAEKQLKASGFSHIKIQTSLDNFPAQKLYRKLQYIEQKNHQRYVYSKAL